MAEIYFNSEKPVILDLRRKYYTTKQAAEKLGISPRRVRKLLEEGRIEGVKLGNTWVVSKLAYTKKRG
jgi:excisionase family DNA binding protein